LKIVYPNVQKCYHGNKSTTVFGANIIYLAINKLAKRSYSKVCWDTKHCIGTILTKRGKLTVYFSKKPVPETGYWWNTWELCNSRLLPRQFTCRPFKGCRYSFMKKFPIIDFIKTLCMSRTWCWTMKKQIKIRPYRGFLFFISYMYKRCHILNIFISFIRLRFLA